MAKKDYAKAIEHFTSALSNGREDARCLAERGYAHWLLKKKPAAKSDFWEAAGASPESEVAGQIWYNLGLVYEDEGDTEMSRAAFAMSYAMRQSKAAKAKLGGRSACRSMIASGPAAARPRSPSTTLARKRPSAVMTVRRRLSCRGEG
jgi:tetratricopeptide (TPR) repeat protein